ncbi:MAG: hypothetical protein HRT52_22380 [Colwellia sp.]|nr:hypothetical protein [Colwellia sp.]
MQFNNKLIMGCSLALSVCFSSAIMAVDYSQFAVLGTSNNDGLSIDASGNLYVTNSGKFNLQGTALLGDTVRKITPSGTISVAVTDLAGPLGSAFDSDGNMYIANYNNGVITKVTPSGIVSTFASFGLSAPSGIIINSQDEMFVSSYTGNVLHKLTMDGESEVLVQDSGLDGPTGMAIDEAGNLYVGNYEFGKLYKVDANNNMIYLGTVPGGIGYIAYHNGTIYATGIAQDKIYQIPAEGGQAEELEGSSVVGLNSPNGIIVNDNGSKIYVSNYQNNKIVLIENFDNTNPIQPQTQSDNISVTQDSVVLIPLLSNDIHSGGTLDPTTVSIVTSVQNGSTTINTSTGVVTYTPTAGYIGEDSFVYTVNNLNGDISNETNVTITVEATAVVVVVTPPVVKQEDSSPSSSGGPFGIYLLIIMLITSSKGYILSTKN